MSYIIRTNHIGEQPHYFCGLVDGENLGMIGNPIMFTHIIFQAFIMETREEAQECIEQLGLGSHVTISEITHMGGSPELMQ